MTSKCKQYCSVPQCHNYRTETITMHMFPSNNEIKEKWRVALRIGKKISRGMMVCSEHFLPIDFHPATEYTMKRFLKRRVVPSLKIPIRQHDTTPQTSSSSARAVRAEIRAQIRTSTSAEAREPPYMEIAEQNVAEEAELLTDIKCLTDVGIQVNTMSDFNAMCNFTDYLVTSSTKLSIFCGVSEPLFQVIEKVVINTLGAFKKLNNQNLKKKICIVLTKLKLDLSFRALGVIFEVSSTTAQNYFKDYVQILSYSLRTMIYFTSKEENMNNLPQCFKKYKNVRVVIDATEVPIQKTNCLQCRIRTYSHYKKGHTAKFLICINPAGLICHVSSAYGGRVSDKAIFNNENIMEKLDPFHDAIMVDKGVSIEKECVENNIKLIRPPFLRKKKQFSKEEAILTASIARARIHVERTIQRIKIFKIFTNRLNWTLVPHLDEMMTIVCAIVNLSKPILSDDKF